MRVLVVAALALGGCKRVAPARHIALPPGPTAVLDPSLNPTFPTTQPIVLARYGGGEAVHLFWEVSLWDDGTIRFTGERCHGTRRATLPVPRVHELVDALAQVPDSPASKVCADDFFTDVYAKQRAWRRGDCTRSVDPNLDNALELIRTAIGTMPCDPRIL